jgi:hypothetical protein
MDDNTGSGHRIILLYAIITILVSTAIAGNALWSDAPVSVIGAWSLVISMSMLVDARVRLYRPTPVPVRAARWTVRQRLRRQARELHPTR